MIVRQLSTVDNTRDALARGNSVRLRMNLTSSRTWTRRLSDGEDLAIVILTSFV